jgi:hypothetical protein
MLVDVMHNPFCHILCSIEPYSVEIKMGFWLHCELYRSYLPMSSAGTSVAQTSLLNTSGGSVTIIVTDQLRFIALLHRTCYKPSYVEAWYKGAHHRSSRTS